MRQVMRSPDPKTLARAKETGYGNLFTGARHERPWRPPLMSAQGTRLHARTRIHGVHSALVVGPNGELHCNAREDVRDSALCLDLRCPEERDEARFIAQLAQLLRDGNTT
jgi:uncharacterized protein involved in type VI secretion and phage assembly